MNGKDGYKQMIEMNIFSQRYPCKTKDLLWYKETRQAILLMVKDKKTLDDCELYFLAEYDGAPEIELTNNFETPKDGYENGNCFGHFAFATNNMDEFSNHIKSLGYEFLYEPYELKLKGADGSEKIKKIAFIKDPDGNEIEIIQK